VPIQPPARTPGRDWLKMRDTTTGPQSRRRHHDTHARADSGSRPHTGHATAVQSAAAVTFVAVLVIFEVPGSARIPDRAAGRRPV